jgi:hypothetical protein
VDRECRRYGNLDVLQHYEPSWPVAGIALPTAADENAYDDDDEVY